jgi:hypothetical protein
MLDRLDTRYWMLEKSKIKNQKSKIPRSGQTPNNKPQLKQLFLIFDYGNTKI